MVAGLSVAEVVDVKGRSITLGGADMVDGSPVLDIKPYLPFCDSLSQAIAPPWVIICPLTSVVRKSTGLPVTVQSLLNCICIVSTAIHVVTLQANIPYASPARLLTLSTVPNILSDGRRLWRKQAQGEDVRDGMSSCCRCQMRPAMTPSH